MDEKEQMQIEQTLYVAGLCLPGLFALAYLLFRMLPEQATAFFRMPCVFHAVTGFYCPGCGGTRAALALLHGEWLRSFFLHPLVPYCAALYLWFMASQTAWRISAGRLRVRLRYRSQYAVAALVLVLVNLAVKNLALALFGVDLTLLCAV